MKITNNPRLALGLELDDFSGLAHDLLFEMGNFELLGLQHFLTWAGWDCDGARFALLHDHRAIRFPAPGACYPSLPFL